VICRKPRPSPYPTRVFTMPVLAPTAARTLRMLQHARVEVSRLARVIESDADWAAEVLLQARSPIWGLNAKPADLRDAFGLLGLRRFYQLIAVSAVGPLLRAPLPGYGLLGGELWEHSLSVALATREILHEKELKPCEEAFTAAFLHDVGKLVLSTALEDDPGAVESPDAGAAGFDHAEAGAALLNHWNMPYWLVAAVRLHHAASDGSFVIADLVGLAEGMCLGGADGDDEEMSEMKSRWALSRRSVARIQERTREAFAQAQEPAGAGEGR